MRQYPSWWNWELELSYHVLQRMVDRGFNETDLRAMLDQASGMREDVDEARWVVVSKHAGRRWEIVLELDPADEVLVVVTAYPVG